MLGTVVLNLKQAVHLFTYTQYINIVVGPSRNILEATYDLSSVILLIQHFNMSFGGFKKRDSN